MHTTKTSIEPVLRDALDPARAPRSRSRKSEALRKLGDWILRDLGMSRSEHDKANERIVMLRAFHGL